MIYLLILRALLGPAIVGQYDTEEACAEGAAKYMAMLVEQRSDEKHNAKIGCVGFPIETLTPPMLREARGGVREPPFVHPTS